MPPIKTRRIRPMPIRQGLEEAFDAVAQLAPARRPCRGLRGSAGRNLMVISPGRFRMRVLPQQ